MRRSSLYIVVLFLTFTFSLNANAQSTPVTDRTAEQEAVKQTEKLQQELNLSNQQAKSIYDINLKYALERKQSNKRTDAINRIKKKNDEINRVLNNRQREELQTKRSTVQSVEIDGQRRYSSTDTKGRVDNNSRSNSNNANSRTAGRTQQDRPVRSDFNTRQPLASSVRDSEIRTTDRPARGTTSSVRPQNGARGSDSNVKDSRSSNRTNVEQRSSSRSVESRASNTRSTRNESQRSSRESGSRR